MMFTCSSVHVNILSLSPSQAMPDFFTNSRSGSFIVPPPPLSITRGNTKHVHNVLGAW